MVNFATPISIRGGSDSVVDLLFVPASRDNQFTALVRRSTSYRNEFWVETYALISPPEHRVKQRYFPSNFLFFEIIKSDSSSLQDARSSDSHLQICEKRSNNQLFTSDMWYALTPPHALKFCEDFTSERSDKRPHVIFSETNRRG
jgi:hypothetical protein